MSDLKNPLGGAATEKRTLVEEGTTFKGTLSSTCPIFVKGGVEGDVQAPALTVAASGTVSGKVKAGELKSEGSIAGDFDVDKVQLSGVVRDNTVIKAKSLEVKLSQEKSKMQVVFGECDLEIGDAPAREKGADKDGDRSERRENGKSVPPPADG
jgi:cytoskeletal protein CcmA (bactofilin family)